jgi:hypothetical protein
VRWWGRGELDLHGENDSRDAGGAKVSRGRSLKRSREGEGEGEKKEVEKKEGKGGGHQGN